MNDIRKEYFNMPWASLRSMVEPSFAERSVINHTDYLPNVQMITSSATNITDSEVETADGHKVAYDYLVIATGHLEPAPKTREERLNEYKAGEHTKTQHKWEHSISLLFLWTVCIIISFWCMMGDENFTF
jgi:hypothetical protein